MATVPEELKTKKDDAPVVETIAEVTETPVDKAENPVATKTAEPQGFYTDYFAKYGPNKPMSEAELAKEAKKRKREKIFAAIGDGISALSNLYFTTKGAPSVAQNPMSDKVKARWDAIDAERKGNETAWYQGYLQSLQLDDARAAAKRKEKADERDYKLRRDQYERQLAKDKVDAAVKDLEMKRKLKLIDQAEHDARLAKVLADYAEKNGVQMGKAKIGGSTKQKTSKWTAYNPTTGEKITIDASSEAHAWSQVPEGYVIREAPEKTTTTVEETPLGKTTKTTTKTEGKSSGGYKKTTEDNTPPSRKKSEGKTNDNNDNRPPSRR